MTNHVLAKFMQAHNLGAKDIARIFGVKVGAVTFWLNCQRKMPETTRRLMLLIDVNPVLIESLELMNTIQNPSMSRSATTS